MVKAQSHPEANNEARLNTLKTLHCTEKQINFPYFILILVGTVLQLVHGPTGCQPLLPLYKPQVWTCPDTEWTVLCQGSRVLYSVF